MESSDQKTNSCLSVADRMAPIILFVFSASIFAGFTHGINETVSSTSGEQNQLSDRERHEIDAYADNALNLLLAERKSNAHVRNVEEFTDHVCGEHLTYFRRTVNYLRYGENFTDHDEPQLLSNYAARRRYYDSIWRRKLSDVVGDPSQRNNATAPTTTVTTTTTEKNKSILKYLLRAGIKNPCEKGSPKYDTPRCTDLK